MKLLLAGLIYKSVVGTFCVLLGSSAIASVTSVTALFVASPFVNEITEEQIKEVVTLSTNSAGKYFSYLVLLTIFGSRLYHQNSELMEIEEELFKFDRAPITGLRN